MPTDDTRVQVRLFVEVTVDLASPELKALLQSRHALTSAVNDVVADEVRSNLESVSYVDAVIVDTF